MSKGLTFDLISDRVIKTTGGEFSVRGLALADLIAMVEHSREALSDLFDRLVVQGDGGPQLSLEQAGTLGGTLLAESPAIAALIIATAAGPVTDEALQVAAALPVAVQVAALEAIAEQTFTSEMPPKKVLEIVVKAMGGTANVLAGHEA